MNWITLFITCLIASGGFLAATYEDLAKRKGLPTGLSFKLGGIVSGIGAIICFGSIILSAFINPWWSIFIVFISAWVFTELIVVIFKAMSQIVSLFLIVIGIILLIIKLTI